MSTDPIDRASPCQSEAGGLRCKEPAGHAARPGTVVEQRATPSTLTGDGAPCPDTLSHPNRSPRATPPASAIRRRFSTGQPVDPHQPCDPAPLQSPGRRVSPAVESGQAATGEVRSAERVDVEGDEATEGKRRDGPPHGPTVKCAETAVAQVTVDQTRGHSPQNPQLSGARPDASDRRVLDHVLDVPRSGLAKTRWPSVLAVLAKGLLT